jgi:hypothetical protein
METYLLKPKVWGGHPRQHLLLVPPAMSRTMLRFKMAQYQGESSPALIRRERP